MKNYKPTYFDKIVLRRILASIIDLFVCFIIVTVIWILLSILGFITFGVIEKAIPFIFPVILSTYYSFSVGGKKGLTLGMILFGINFLNKNNQNLGVKELFIYNLLFFLVIPVGILLLVAIILPLISKERKCLQDYIFKTKFILKD